MKIYKCPRCNYTTHILTIYVRHLKRKKICEPTISKTDLQKEYIKYDIKDKLKMNPKESLTESKLGFMNPNESKRIHFCKYCENTYSTNSNLCKHLKKCKEKKKTDEASHHMQELVNLLNEKNEKISKYDLELDKKNKQIDELIKKAGINIGTQNIQQNIKILAYDNTDLSHLKNKDYLKCLRRSNFCIPHLIEKIHFNPEKPENHNIYISNLKNNYVMIYNGEKWMINDRDESIQNLIDDKESIIEQKLEEWIENGKNYPDIMKKFNRYLEKKENDKVLDKIKNEIKLILFNNRDIVSKKT